jgi:hypothetical protein
VYIDGLRSADEPIVDRLRLEIFLDDVFHNYRSLLDIHTDLLEKLHARQEEQHPRIGAVSDLIYDAALRWQDAIIEYGSHYPKAKYAWEHERRTNSKFAAFLDVSLSSSVNIPRSNCLHSITHSVVETRPARTGKTSAISLIDLYLVFCDIRYFLKTCSRTFRERSN